MISASAPNRKALAELSLVEGITENQTARKGTSPMTVQIAADTRQKHLRARRIAWWGIAVLAALVVVLAANPLVTDGMLWAAFVVGTRLAVVDRRRARRAAHRAQAWERIATHEAIVVANAHALDGQIAA